MDKMQDICWDREALCEPGSKARQLYSDAADLYYEASTWPTWHAKKRTISMRAIRMFKKAEKERAKLSRAAI